ncbi:MAG: hypothetical protein ABL888_04655 [Pirellulaceae bacterium]
MSQNSETSTVESLSSADCRDRMKCSRKLASKGLLIALAFFVVVQTGCSVISTNPGRTRLVDDMFVRYRDVVWARRAYNLEHGTCSRPFADHFQRGYVAGYCSVCRGGDGYVPATPSKDYMGYEYQSEDGAACVNAWFEGYPLGAQAAKNRNLDKYGNIYISRLMEQAIDQSEVDPKLPSDVPIVSPSGDAHSGSLPENAPPMPIHTYNSNNSNRSLQYR